MLLSNMESALDKFQPEHHTKLANYVNTCSAYSVVKCFMNIR